MLHDIPRRSDQEIPTTSSLNYSPAVWRLHPGEPDILATGDSASTAIRLVLAHQKQNPAKDERSKHKSSYLESNRAFSPQGKNTGQICSIKNGPFSSLPHKNHIRSHPAKEDSKSTKQQKANSNKNKVTSSPGVVTATEFSLPC